MGRPFGLYRNRGSVLTLTIEDVAVLDAAYWAELRKIKLQTGEFSFDGHEYQREPMRSEERRICCRKATQGGFTEIFVLKSLHGMIHGLLPSGVVYLFPTTDNVTDFSKSRFGPLIDANPEYIKRFVKERGSGPNTANLKKVGSAFLYLKGARLNQSVGFSGNDKESGHLRSVPADVCVFDELDLMDDQAIEKAKGRMGHSKVKGEWYLSNPTIPGMGIDAQFAQSDQRYWFRKCRSCGTYTSADIEFPGCVKEYPDGTGYIACRKCGKPVRLEDGVWAPQAESNSGYMHGYHWSQLDSGFNDPAEILRSFHEPPNGNLGDVKRLRLGIPHVEAEDQLQASVIRECCTLDSMPDQHNGPCAMGVDMGKGKHVIIGTRTGKDSYEIAKVAVVGDLKDVHDLARRYNVRSAVVDIRPYEDEARAFQKAEPYPIFLSQYLDASPLEESYNPKTGIVKSDRTQMCDRTHRLFTEKRIKIPRRCAAIDMFTNQCCNIAKVLETNMRTGTPIYRYRIVSGLKATGDHYRHALNYFLLAARRCRAYQNTPKGGSRKLAITEYAVF